MVAGIMLDLLLLYVLPLHVSINNFQLRNQRLIVKLTTYLINVQIEPFLEARKRLKFDHTHFQIGLLECKSSLKINHVLLQFIYVSWNTVVDPDMLLPGKLQYFVPHFSLAEA